MFLNVLSVSASAAARSDQWFNVLIGLVTLTDSQHPPTITPRSVPCLGFTCAVDLLHRLSTTRGGRRTEGLSPDRFIQDVWGGGDGGAGLHEAAAGPPAAHQGHHLRRPGRLQRRRRPEDLRRLQAPTQEAPPHRGALFFLSFASHAWRAGLGVLGFNWFD